MWPRAISRAPRFHTKLASGLVGTKIVGGMHLRGKRGRVEVVVGHLKTGWTRMCGQFLGILLYFIVFYYIIRYFLVFYCTLLSFMVFYCILLSSRRISWYFTVLFCFSLHAATARQAGRQEAAGRQQQQPVALSSSRAEQTDQTRRDGPQQTRQIRPDQTRPDQTEQTRQARQARAAT